MKSLAGGLLEETTNDFFKKERKLNTQLGRNVVKKVLWVGGCWGEKGRRKEDRREGCWLLKKLSSF